MAIRSYHFLLKYFLIPLGYNLLRFYLSLLRIRVIGEEIALGCLADSFSADESIHPIRGNQAYEREIPGTRFTILSSQIWIRTLLVKVSAGKGGENKNVGEDFKKKQRRLIGWIRTEPRKIYQKIARAFQNNSMECPCLNSYQSRSG